MTEDKGILIKNVYYMLSYAFQVLRERQFENIASEDFDNVANLCAEILVKGISKQLKQGLYYNYVETNDNITSVRGRININDTINLLRRREKKLYCEFDEFSSDNIYNRILKFTIRKLLNCAEVDKKRKRELYRTMIYFNSIGDITIVNINWNSLIYNKNNQMYVMLMNICYFVIHDILLTTEKGQYKMPMFSDDTMERLYEKFILNYYKRNHPELHPKSSQIEWDLKEGNAEFLPAMISDITLYNSVTERTLIIDAKYYRDTLVKNQFGKRIYHSNNLYQIMSYVRNHDKEAKGRTEGMLLYAKTSEEVTPNNSFVIGANKYMVRTLDLNKPFLEIAEDLEQIVKCLTE